MFRFIALHPFLAGITVLILAGAGFGVYALTREPPPQYVLATVERGDLLQTVEVVGEVISESDISLRFPVSGIVESVSVQEGQVVTAGQRLAALRAGSLLADIDSAQAQVASARATLAQLEEGIRPEEISVTEAEVRTREIAVESARTALDIAEQTIESVQEELATLRQQADIAVAGQLASTRATAVAELADTRLALTDIQAVFDGNDIQDLLILEGSIAYPRLEQGIERTLNDLDTMEAGVLGDIGLEEMLTILSDVRRVFLDASRLADDASLLISSLPVTGSYSQTDKGTDRSAIATERAAIQSSISTLESSRKSLSDASADFRTRIAAQQEGLIAAQGTVRTRQEDVQSALAALTTARAQLALKQAPSRQGDIDAARAAVSQAEATLKRAQSSYADTLLIAPANGTITQISIDPGESAPSGEVMRMLGTSPLRMEMFVSEIDVPKLEPAQRGSVLLDAFPRSPFELQVGSIDPASVERDGVEKFRVKLDFLNLDNAIRIGMTGDITVITGMRNDILYLPSRAVLEDGDEMVVRVLTDDGMIIRRSVTLGMEGEGGLVEVEGEIDAGDDIVVLVRE